MLKTMLTIAGIILAAIVMAQRTIIIKIDSLPAYHSAGSDIYIAGSFNGWNAQDPDYRFHNTGGNYYEIQLSLNDGNYEYKLTRGGWDKVECKKDGSSIDNHLLKITGDSTFILKVEEWSDRFPSPVRRSTASKNVHIVDSAFFIPQLMRTRRIWIYLPEGYEKSAKRYPVLYMQDGQNVFDEATSFAGEWGVDEYFDSAPNKTIQSIVVAIDNGDGKRMNEYSPYDTEKFGNGEANAYADFLVTTLKPFIDQCYRTKKDKANTFIAGSSMGGLVSFYTLLKYPGTFGGAGIFSPSLWIAPKLMEEIKSIAPSINSKVYFYAGKGEGASMTSDTESAYELMKKYSTSKLTIDIMNEGKHDEPSWRKEFPKFYEWLTQ